MSLPRPPGDGRVREAVRKVADCTLLGLVQRQHLNPRHGPEARRNGQRRLRESGCLGLFEAIQRVLSKGLDRRKLVHVDALFLDDAVIIRADRQAAGRRGGRAEVEALKALLLASRAERDSDVG